jgi:membrane associated rhomboid family serine protease
MAYDRRPMSEEELPSDAQPVAVFRSRVSRRAREYGLVLQAVGIPCALLQDGAEHVVAVDLDFAQRATTELREYERENRGWRTTEELPLALTHGWLAVALWSTLLFVMFAFDRNDAFGLRWWEHGRSVATLVREGEWWRAITALTLHADIVHVASNVIFGALFLALVCELLGTGAGLLAVLASGALGNYLNAWIQGDSFSSIGASTAVFGALGLIGAHRWQRRKVVRSRGYASWIPLVASAFLLAYLGSGGDHTRSAQRIDVVGHLCGFAVGAVIGAVHGRFAPREHLNKPTQLVLGFTALTVLGGAWWIALSR